MPRKVRSVSPAPRRTSWSETAGAGKSDGAFLGLEGELGATVALVGVSLLILLCPAVVIGIYVLNADYDGSVLRLLAAFTSKEGVKSVLTAWPALLSSKSAEALVWVLTFGVLQAVLQLFVPGKTFYGPVSPKGNVPEYKANGVSCFLITGALFFLGARSGVFRPERLYDIFGEVLSVLNAFALLLCVALTLKGLRRPSSSDSGSNGNLVYDFYWGTELYPRIGKAFDIKTWTNCRMGMMSWAFMTMCFAMKQRAVTGHVASSMLVSVILQSAYCLKFFLWETGYWKTMDIAHDRAGYYLCWGCLVWVPGLYTSPALYLVRHPTELTPWVACGVLLLGLAAIYVNWEADDQRQRVRETDGHCLVWGRKPDVIVAGYQSGGELKSSLLLASGWWGLARHMHYVPEILAAVCWTAPAGARHGLPWFYVAFLTVLLLDRLYRDQTRCKAKYGEHWDEYCRRVPYMVIPYVL